MKTLTDFFQEDCEAFSSQLLACESEREAETKCEEELSRLLSAYNDQNLSEPMRRSANEQISALRAALPLMCAHGDVRIIQEPSSGHKRNGNALFRILAWIFAAAALVLSLLEMQSLTRASLLAFACAAGACVFFWLYGKSFHEVHSSEDLVHGEVAIDPEAIVHAIKGMLAVVDHALQDLAAEEKSQQRILLKKESGSSEDSSLDVYQRLLECAFAERDSDLSKEVVSEIHYALHMKGISIVEDDRRHPEYFDHIPGSGGIVRPALVKDGFVMRRGLAAGGGR